MFSKGLSARYADAQHRYPECHWRRRARRVRRLPNESMMVSRLNHVEIVFDHQHCIAQRNQSLQDVQKLVHVRKVKAGGRLVKNINGAPGRAF